MCYKGHEISGIKKGYFEQELKGVGGMDVSFACVFQWLDQMNDTMNQVKLVFARLTKYCRILENLYSTSPPIKLLFTNSDYYFVN